MEQQKTLWPIEKLRNWEKNPRSIRQEDFEKLKKKIQKFGQFRPLIVTPEGVVLGGNMRLRAFKEIGTQEIWVSIVEPKDETEMLEIALADNERSGYYDDQVLAELLATMPDFPLVDYKVDLGYASTLQRLMENFGPSEVRGVDADSLETDQLDTYLNANVKQIVLYFESEQFSNVIARLQAVIEKYALKNNTEAVLRLLEFYENSGEKE